MKSPKRSKGVMPHSTFAVVRRGTALRAPPPSITSRSGAALPDCVPSSLSGMPRTTDPDEVTRRLLATPPLKRAKGK